MDDFVFARSWNMTDYSSNDFYLGGSEPWLGFSGGYPQPSVYNVVADVSHSEISENIFHRDDAAPVYEQEAPTAPDPPEPKRPRGNNPFGSRGCASCVRCRKRKGKVLQFQSLLTEVRVHVPNRGL
jgi:hypothetical protein